MTDNSTDAAQALPIWNDDQWTDYVHSLIEMELHPEKPAPPPQEEEVEPFMEATNEPLPSANKRFKFASTEELTKLGEGLVPQNTSSSTKWALKNFNQWKELRNSQFVDDQVPENLLEQCTDPKILCDNLSKFVVETRKCNGDKYPPATLHGICVGYCGI